MRSHVAFAVALVAFGAISAVAAGFSSSPQAADEYSLREASYRSFANKCPNAECYQSTSNAAQKKRVAEMSLDERWQTIRDFISAVLNQTTIGGIAVGVTDVNTTLFAEGFGYLDIARTKPHGPNQRVPIASVTKSFTATLAVIAQAQGKLQLEEPISKHIPGFELWEQSASNVATLRDCLSHMTGIGRLGFASTNNNMTLQEIAYNLRYVQPQRQFRSHWEYSNYVLALAGYAIGNAVDLSWYDQIRTRIFAPLGMNDSFATIQEALDTLPSSQWPIGTTCSAGHPVEFPLSDETLLDRFSPAGSIISTVNDMMKYTRMHMNTGVDLGLTTLEWSPLVVPNAVMLPSLTQIYPTITGNTYALCLEPQKYRMNDFITHDGNSLLHTSHFGFIFPRPITPLHRIGYFLSANAYGANLVLQMIGQYIADTLSGYESPYTPELVAAQQPCAPPQVSPEAPMPPMPAPPPSPVSYRPISDYVGNYSNPFFGPLVFVEQEGQLCLTQNGQTVPLSPLGFPDIFQLGLLIANFQRDTYGLVQSVSSKIEGGIDPIVFVRPGFSHVHWYGMANGITIKNTIVEVTPPQTPPQAPIHTEQPTAQPVTAESTTWAPGQAVVLAVQIILAVLSTATLLVVIILARRLSRSGDSYSKL